MGHFQGSHVLFLLIMLLTVTTFCNLSDLSEVYKLCRPREFHSFRRTVCSISKRSVTSGEYRWLKHKAGVRKRRSLSPDAINGKDGSLRNRGLNCDDCENAKGISQKGQVAVQLPRRSFSHSLKDLRKQSEIENTRFKFPAETNKNNSVDENIPPKQNFRPELADITKRSAKQLLLFRVREVTDLPEENTSFEKDVNSEMTDEDVRGTVEVHHFNEEPLNMSTRLWYQTLLQLSNKIKTGSKEYKTRPEIDTEVIPPISESDYTIYDPSDLFVANTAAEHVTQDQPDSLNSNWELDEDVVFVHPIAWKTEFGHRATVGQLREHCCLHGCSLNQHYEYFLSTCATEY